MSGIEAAQLISQTVSTLKVNIISQHDSTVLRHATALPARAAVTKSQLSQDLILAIETVIAPPNLPVRKKRREMKWLRRDLLCRRDEDPIAAIVNSS